MQVFADHHTSHFPLIVPSEALSGLERAAVYFGSNVTSMLKGNK